MPRGTPRSTRAGRGRGTIAAHLITLVVIQLVLVGILVAFAARYDFQKARADTEARVASTSKLAVDYVAKEFEDNVVSLSELPAVLGAVSADKLCEIEESSPDEDDPRWFRIKVHILRPDGSGGCASNGRQPNVGREQWFRAALASEDPVIEGPLTDPITRKRVVMQAIAASPQLVVAYSVELDSVGRALDNQFGGDRAAVRFTIVDAAHRTEIGSSGDHTGRPAAGSGFARALTPSRNTFEDLDGIERIYAERTVPDRGWHLFAGVSTVDAFGDANRALRERILFAAFIVLVVVLAAAVIQRRIVRPIRALSRIAQRFGRGDKGIKVKPSGPVELAGLAETMNEMIRIRAGAEAALEKAFAAEQRATAELREVDGMRQAFLMAISHELRTPLTSVAGYAAFLKDAGDSLSAEEVSRCIDSIASQSQRLERLLLDLLDVERLARGAVEPSRRETDMRELIPRVLDGIAASERVSTSVSATAHGVVDPALVERIIENLVLNAIKHTPPDSRIWLRATRRNGDVKISVEDDGPGVPDDLKERIFEAFEQGNVPSHSPGTGVGLSLVSQFAKLHGGRAWVDDRRGGGAAFHVVLPARADYVKRPVRGRSRTKAAAAA